MATDILKPTIEIIPIICCGSSLILVGLLALSRYLNIKNNTRNLGGGVIVRRFRGGHGSITIPGGPGTMRGMGPEETAKYFEK